MKAYGHTYNRRRRAIARQIQRTWGMCIKQALEQADKDPILAMARAWPINRYHTMKAIQTTYLGATNTRPSRIKASDCDGNSVTISYPHGLSDEAAFRKAADALCLKMGWKGPLVGGGLKNGWVFCFAEACPEVLALTKAGDRARDVISDLEFPTGRESLRQIEAALAPFTSNP